MLINVCNDTVTPVPMLYIGFEQAMYTFSESGAETNPQVCVTVSGESTGVTAVVEVTINPITAQGMSSLD